MRYLAILALIVTASMANGQTTVTTVPLGGGFTSSTVRSPGKVVKCMTIPLGNGFTKTTCR